MKCHRLRLIIRSLASKRNSTLNIRFSLAFLIIMIGILLFLMNGNELLAVQKAYDEYGKYSFSFFNEGNLLNDVINDGEVMDYISVGRENIEIENAEIKLYGADERVLEFINASMIEGHYPEKDNEIAAERGLLYRYGIEENKSIGSRIKLNDKEYTVSGIIYVNDQNDIAQASFVALKKQSGDVVKEVLIQLKDVRDYKRTIDHLAEKYKLDKKTCYVNVGLFASLGVISDGQTFKNDKYIFGILYIILLFAMLPATFNYIDIWVYRVKDTISDLHTLGIPDGLVGKALYLSMLIEVLISMGFAVGTIVVGSFLLWKIVYFRIDALLLFATYPYMTLGISVLVLLLLLGIRLFFVVRRGVLKNRHLEKKQMAQSRIFKMDTSFYRFRLFRSCIKKNKLNTLCAIIAVSFSITAFITMSYFLDTSGREYGVDTNMDYQAVFTPGYRLDEDGIREQEIEYMEMISDGKNSFEIWPMYIENKWIDIDRELLSDEYICFLNEISSDGGILGIRQDGKIRAGVSMIGYTDEQLQKLCKKNNVEDLHLKDDQLIALSKTGKMRDDFSFETNIAQGDYLYVDGREYEVVYVVDDLPLWPAESTNQMCLIVNSSYFARKKGSIVPDSVYINVFDDRNMESAEKKLLGKKYSEIKKIREQEEYLEKSDTLKKGLFLTLIVVLACVGNAVLGSLLYRFETNSIEYKTMHLLGIADKDVILIWLYEVIEIMAVSVLVMIISVLCATYYISVKTLGEVGKYIYSFPVSNLIYSVTLMIGLNVVVAAIISKHIKEAIVLN